MCSWSPVWRDGRPRGRDSPRGLRHEERREVLDGEDQRVGAPVRTGGGGDRDVGEALEQLLEHDLDLEAGQVGAEAEVRTDAEAEVRVRAPVDPELVGI